MSEWLPAHVSGALGRKGAALAMSCITGDREVAAGFTNEHHELPYAPSQAVAWQADSTCTRDAIGTRARTRPQQTVHTDKLRLCITAAKCRSSALQHSS